MPEALPTVAEVLAPYRLDPPVWLSEYQAGDEFPREKFFQSRTVYYPGSGTDGQPLRVFGGSHCAQCYVFVDYREGGTDEVLHQLADSDHAGHPKGYRPIEVRRLPQAAFWPPSRNLHVSMPASTRQKKAVDAGPPTAVWAVLERSKEYGQNHGSDRLAILFVSGDGFETFDALYCQGMQSTLFAVLLQDHGYGGNWTRFGSNRSPLWDLAQRFATPEWLLVAENTRPWPGYSCASAPDRGGMYSKPRRLYRRVIENVSGDR